LVSHNCFAFSDQKVANVTMRRVVRVYQGRRVEKAEVPLPICSDAFDRAEKLNEAMDAADARHNKPAAERLYAQLLQHLRAHAGTDADCATLLAQWVAQDDDYTFADRIKSALKALHLAQATGTFHAEVGALAVIGKLLLHDDFAYETLEIYAMAMDRVRRGMLVEDRYEAWARLGHTCEVVADTKDEALCQSVSAIAKNESMLRTAAACRLFCTEDEVPWHQLVVQMSIFSYKKAQAVAQQDEQLRNIYFVHGRLLVLELRGILGADVADNDTNAQMRAACQEVVDRLVPRRILAWLDNNDFGLEYTDIADIICMIGCTIIHQHVAGTSQEASSLIERARRAGVANDIAIHML